MRVRMRTHISGTRAGVDWPPAGGEIDLPDDEGARLCAAGMAEPVAVRPAEEHAVAPPAEERAKPRTRQRQKRNT